MRAPDITRRTGLNRTVLLRPGAPWHGRPAGRVLGATGLSSTVRAAASEAGAGTDGAPLQALDRALLAGDPWAQEVAGAWVDALSHLLRTLREPTDVDRDARPEWDDADWARWSSASRVLLCGGVVAGELGVRAADDPGVRAHRAEVAQDPAHACLHGLAGGDDGPVLVLDLGHSSIMAATVSDGALGPPATVPVPWHPFDTDTWPSPDALLDLVAAACRTVLPAPGSLGPLRVRVAVANYVVDGRLDDDQTYGTLARPGADPRDTLSTELSDRLARPVRVEVLVNDGAAAALSVEPHATLPAADAPTTAGGGRGPLTAAPAAAVISIGTSLGVGFAGA
ncbi:hypothetical protein AVL62_06250 [Serinicoccus chungangensis]|uniref:Uncharacterized protein n=1 Tax=Serinicoccus chungangensis TaxID=767452 RepID=A0A0W8IH02_9MICO|nr:hypothetical protein [Serinicoccus chungangensis]KUG59278.1 hypothetical protein AVL62_06250 [Serinicoccus chungangensis]